MDLRRLLFLFAVAAFSAAFLRTFVAEAIYIASGSMEPQLPVGTHVFMDKVTFWFRNPARGDIIVFASPVDENEDLVKRVIAVPGDTVELKEKTVIINGKTLQEDYVQHTRGKEELHGDNLPPMRVPRENLFVLGDNRDESNDSSVWRDPKTMQPVYFVPYSNVRGIIRGFY